MNTTLQSLFYIQKIIRSAVRNPGTHSPLYVRTPVGVGTQAAIKLAAVESGAEYRDVRMMHVDGARADAFIHSRNVHEIENDAIVSKPPIPILSEFPTDRPVVLVLDYETHHELSVVSIANMLVLAETAMLPPNVFLVITESSINTGNRVLHGAAMLNRVIYVEIAPPLANDQ
jgi:hypothetical protein